MEVWYLEYEPMRISDIMQPIETTICPSLSCLLVSIIWPRKKKVKYTFRGIFANLLQLSFICVLIVWTPLAYGRSHMATFFTLTYWDRQFPDSWVDTRLSCKVSFICSARRYVLIPKSIGNRKRDCTWGSARGINTTWENLQIEKHKSGRRSLVVFLFHIYLE